MADPGEGTGGPAPPPLTLDQTQARRAEKRFLETAPRPLHFSYKVNHQLGDQALCILSKKVSEDEKRSRKNQFEWLLCQCYCLISLYKEWGVPFEFSKENTIVIFSKAGKMKSKRRHGRGDVVWQAFRLLYYYMRNFCNLTGVEQWYFSLIWNTYVWKLQSLLRVVV